MPREYSVGIITYCGNEFLLLKYEAGHWAFVKGAPEKSEDNIEAARREILEEAGIKGIYITKDFSVKESYFYKKDGQTIYKEVEYFLGEVREKEVKISKEHIDYRWLKYEEAMSLLTYRQTKEALKKAYDYLKRHGVFK